MDAISTGAQLRLRLEGPSDCIIEADVPRRAGAGLTPGQQVRLRPEAGQIFSQTVPGGAGAKDAPARPQSEIRIKESHS